LQEKKRKKREKRERSPWLIISEVQTKQKNKSSAQTDVCQRCNTLQIQA